MRAGFAEALRSEWTKYRTIRTPLALTAVLGLAFPALAVLVGATESLQPDDTVLGASVMGGAVLAQVVAACLGATLVTSEVRAGTLPVTFAACPRRTVVLAAKAVVTAAVTAAVALPSSLVAFLVGDALLDETYARGTPFPALLGVAAALAAGAVLGVGLGAVVRHGGGTVAAVVAVALAPGLLAPLLGPARRWVGGASLDGVLQKLTQSSDATPEAVGSLGAWPSLAVVAAYATAAVAGAVWVLRHRDT